MRFHSPFTVFRNDRGNVAIITAACILPLTFLVGMSIDLSNATRVRVALQDAADSAALAIARNAANIAVGNENAAAYNYVGASFQKNIPYTATATLDRATLTAKVTAQAQVPTTFSALLGKTQLAVGAFSEVKGQGYDYEIMLALDNSGSMTATAGVGSTKIAELKTATKALLDAMITTSTTGRVKIGIVPFAASVNVGSSNRTAAWLDTDGLGSISNENFNTSPVKRLDLYDESKGGMKGVSWAGCVETRRIWTAAGTPVNYDANDAVPATTTPDTLFTPWFAPDESDLDNFKSSGGGKYDYRNGPYANNYLDDERGACTGADASAKASDITKQRRICKYKGETPNLANGRGPNYMCTTTAITPLTSTRATLDAAVTAMVANGNTNILEGVMWAWRGLSPTAPFTEGADYNTKNLNKIIILMSDGENNYPGASNDNHSNYFSYGYSVQNRIGSTSSDTSTLIAKLDGRTKVACDNAKAANITIYTVALGDGADTALLAYCASKPSYAYAPKNGSELTPVFQEIAASINKLRLTQ